MGTGRTFNKAPRTRPKKKPMEKRRRVRLQRERLIGLGVEAETVRTMNDKAVRQMLIRPKRVAASNA